MHALSLDSRIRGFGGLGLFFFLIFNILSYTLGTLHSLTETISAMVYSHPRKMFGVVRGGGIPEVCVQPHEMKK